MNIDVLGTKYTVEEIDSRQDACLRDCGGYCDFSVKKIAIRSDYDDDPHMSEDTDFYKRLVMRHEAVHAYLHESGLTDYSLDEQLVDWIACQFPKMLKTFKAMGAIK